MDQNSNPFLAALPQVYDEATLAEKVGYYPQFDLNASKIEKLISLSELYDYYEPLPAVSDLYIHAATMIYGGYKRRTPQKLIEFIRTAQNLTHEKVVEMINEKALILNPSQSLSFLGFPGMGKTLACLKLQQLFPVKIVHTNEFHLIQVPIISIECPSKGSTLQLCRNFMQKLDMMIQTDYSKKTKRDVEIELMRKMALYCAEHFIGLIIIDEFHNMQVGTEKQIDEMIGFLKFLNNVMKVPIIFVGSFQAERILYRTMQNASRLISLRLKRVKVKTDKGETDEVETEKWDFMVTELWKHQVFKPGELTQEIKDTYYKYSQGIYRILTTLHAAAQRWALINQREDSPLEITVETLNEAAKEELYSVEIMILALENKDDEILELFDDLQQSKVDIYKSYKAEKKTVRDPEDLFVLGRRFMPDISDEKLNECVNKILTEFTDLKLNDQFLKLKELVNQLPKEPKGEKKEKKVPTGKLIDITKNAKTPMEAHELLVQAGIIRPILDFIEL